MRTFKLEFTFVLFVFSMVVQAAPEDFSQAKRLLREHVYFDQNQSAAGDFYCGCKWEWVGKSGGRMDQSSCGYNSSKMPERAARLEWEHILPISAVGQQRQCWRDGGRKNCQATDPVFNRMEADMFNLTPSIGSVNAMRSNWLYGMATGPVEPLGACSTKVATSTRLVEPRNEVKGMAARTTFYMADRYGLRLSDGQQRVLMAWDRQYPVAAWEIERDRRIAYSMGHHNAFVTGQLQWSLNHQPTGAGVQTARITLEQPSPQVSGTEKPAQQAQIVGAVHANKRSRVYHLAQGCPSYNQMSQSNKVEFSSESEAVSAGYRKAGNCK
ncbi:endonuclease [Pseudomonas tritici]|uniref:endonuclease n=1 Tax=Pseudomonas tritici TaxID=2745518 RepID=UPI00387B4A56